MRHGEDKVDMQVTEPSPTITGVREEQDVVPVIVVQKARMSRYAPLDVKLGGELDLHVADVQESNSESDVNPEQFVLVIGNVIAILPLKHTKPEIWLHLGEDHVEDLVDRAKKALRAKIAPEDVQGCEDVVVDYRLLGRAPGDGPATGKLYGDIGKRSPSHIGGPAKGGGGDRACGASLPA